MVKIFYNDPQNAGLIPKKFPHGRKYQILGIDYKGVDIQAINGLMWNTKP